MTGCAEHPVDGPPAPLLPALAGGGSLMIMGVYEKPPIFPINDFQEGERRLFTSQAHVDEIAAALSLLVPVKIGGETEIEHPV